MVIIMEGSKEIDVRIIDCLKKFDPILASDGGGVEFLKFENGIVYVAFKGACMHCAHQSMTLDNGIKELLINEIEEVVDVVSV